MGCVDCISTLVAPSPCTRANLLLLFVHLAYDSSVRHICRMPIPVQHPLPIWAAIPRAFSSESSYPYFLLARSERVANRFASFPTKKKKRNRDFTVCHSRPPASRDAIDVENSSCAPSRPTVSMTVSSCPHVTSRCSPRQYLPQTNFPAVGMLLVHCHPAIVHVDGTILPRSQLM